MIIYVTLKKCKKGRRGIKYNRSISKKNISRKTWILSGLLTIPLSVVIGGKIAIGITCVSVAAIFSRV